MNKRRYRGALWGWMALGAVVILLWGRVVYDSAEQGKVASYERNGGKELARGGGTGIEQSI